MSNRMVRVGHPAWWPPAVGDKLRMFDRVEGIGAIARLCHVAAVFEHEGNSRCVVGYYGIYKQWWHYEVVNPAEAKWRFWPDGQECPDAELSRQLRASKAGDQ